MILVGSISISLVFTEWLGWLTADEEKLVLVGPWLMGICLGGYVAACRAEKLGLRVLQTSLWVGIAALVPVITRLPGPPDGDFMDGLQEVFLHPLAKSRHFLLVLLTVPAALAGGLICRHRTLARTDEEQTQSTLP